MKEIPQPPCVSRLATTCQRSVWNELPCSLWLLNRCIPNQLLLELLAEADWDAAAQMQLRRSLHNDCPVSSLWQGSEPSEIEINDWFRGKNS